MYLPSSTSAERSQTGRILTSNAVTYTDPVQYQPNQWRQNGKGTIENNWRQFAFARQLYRSVTYDWTSFRVSAYAVDIYGNSLDIWLTLVVVGGNSDGQVIFDRGWSSDSIDQIAFSPYAANGQYVRCYMRFRYSDDTSNPPLDTDIADARVTIDFQEIVNFSQPQTTALPPDWTVNTTVTATGFPDYPTVTSTYSSDSISSDISTYNPFGIDRVLSTWNSFCSVLVSLHTALPWLSLLIGFSCLCSIIWWLLR